MAVARKDIWATLKELFLEQYRADLGEEISAQGCTLPEGADNRLQGVLKIITDILMQPIDDAAVALKEVLNIDTAEGDWLDIIGKIAGVERFREESDANFRDRIKYELGLHNAGTPDGVIYSAAIMSGDPKPAYLDEAPATFFVYTGPKPSAPVPAETETEQTWEEGGLQLLRRQVQQVAPAGVLGLPGAALVDANGNYILDAEGRVILAVADDSTASRELLVVDNNLNPIVTPQGVPVRAVIVGATVPRVEINYNGVTVDAVRIKDLPDAGEDNAYMVRDSDTGGTVRASALTSQDIDTLWDSTEPEE